MTTKKNKMVKKFVYAEPAFWELLNRLSTTHGCTHHKTGSVSETFRRFAKTGLIKKSPNLKNVVDINWDEMYI